VMRKSLGNDPIEFFVRNTRHKDNHFRRDQPRRKESPSAPQTPLSRHISYGYR
jgi:hypothetical protein